MVAMVSISVLLYFQYELVEIASKDFGLKEVPKEVIRESPKVKHGGIMSDVVRAFTIYGEPIDVSYILYYEHDHTPYDDMVFDAVKLIATSTIKLHFFMEPGSESYPLKLRDQDEEWLKKYHIKISQFLITNIEYYANTYFTYKSMLR